MRAKASKILLLLIVFLPVCGAYARPHKAASKPSRRHVVTDRSAHGTKHARALSIRRHGSSRSTAKPIPRHASGTPAREAVPESPQKDVHVRHNRRPHGATTPATPPVEDRRSSLKQQKAAELLAEAADQAASATTTPAALNPTLDSLYNGRGRLVMPTALKGSREVLLHQNEMADRDGLMRVQDDNDLNRMRDSRMLVAIPSALGLQTDERLPANRRYCRPWTAQFLTALARAHYARFHTALQVNSAVRTVEFQQKLMRRNGNAAPAGGETASPHLTGQAVDLAKHGLSMTEIAWLRGYLLPLMQEGKVDVEEEFQQACFHISVYKKYVSQPGVKTAITETDGQRGSAAALATAMP